ncbi:MAG: hypothetical protein Q8R47_05060 [Nanoarchaeota archaeon]|nr:hypothetical protein [Nanoarchaeota archaeon]
MNSEYVFLRTYLYAVMSIALLGLTDAVLHFLKITPILYVKIVPLVLFLFFFFNIFSIAIFRRRQVRKIVYVLPFYHLLSYILFLSLGLYLTVTGFNPSWLGFALIGIQAASSLFELGFSMYLLMKSEFSPAL